jgi:hypothetical protein
MSSKFDSELAEELYEYTLDSSEDASLGDADTFGWYALFRDERAILVTNSQGFVSAREYETTGAAQIAWDGIEKEYSDFNVRSVVEALNTSCDGLFLIIDTVQHNNGALPDLDDLQEHIYGCAQCKSLGNKHALDI